MKTLLQVDFDYQGPFGDVMSNALKELAESINREPGMIWKIWTENERTQEAGGVYLFESEETAQAYLEMHTARLKAMGVPEGQEWEPFAAVEDPEALQDFLSKVPFFAKGRRRYSAPALPAPGVQPFSEKALSTQQGFGKVLDEIAKKGGPLADRIVTMSPDVTVSTNLGPWVNRRGLFARDIHFERNAIDLACSFFRARKVEIGADHLFRAFLGEPDGHGPSDAAGRAGDHDDLVFQFHMALLRST